jgi:hypothetical protein
MGSKAINRVILYSEPGTTKTHIEEREIEQPGPGQVLIKMSVNCSVIHLEPETCYERLERAATDKLGMDACGVKGLEGKRSID